MAKDGTSRGGYRGNAGRKKKPLAERLLEGKAFQSEFPEIADIDSEDIPEPKTYLMEKQRDGSSLGADEIYRDVYKWLVERKCEDFVHAQVIELYAMSVARYIQCEKAISKYGLIGKHPTTNNPMPSPFVTMSQAYAKQITASWYQINQIVKDNCTESYDSSPHTDLMETLMRAKG